MIVFHIGPPKTATTFLQHQIFAKAAPNDFYHKNNQGNVKVLMKIAQRKALQKSETKSELIEWLSTLSSKGLSIVSNENIASQSEGFWRGTGPSPSSVAKSLLTISTAAGFKPNEIKIIFGVRRQDQMLASRYSQGSTTKPTYSQDGFNELVNELTSDTAIKSGHEWLYFDRTLELFRSIFGIENVLSYSVKDLDLQPDIVIASISGFCEFDFSEALASSIAAGKLKSSNKKSIGTDKWILGTVNKELTVSDQLKQKILTHFDASNNRFMTMTGHNL